VKKHYRNCDQLLNALGQLPLNDVKKLIDELFLKKLFRKPDFDNRSQARRVVKRTFTKGC
jgi:hypothetical protein